jgi:hypothetical protein
LIYSLYKNECRILKPVETTIRKRLRKNEEKNGRDEPIEVIIHIYMEISQGNSLCSYLYLKQAKMSFSLFSSTKSENRRVEQVLWVGREGWYPWEGGGSEGKGVGG